MMVREGSPGARYLLGTHTHTAAEHVEGRTVSCDQERRSWKDVRLQSVNGEPMAQCVSAR